MTGVETMLLGAPLLSATAGASTVGLIGAGGAFAPAMGTLFSGSALSALSTGLTLASASSSLFGGLQQASALKTQGAQEAWALNMTAREDMLSAKEEVTRGKEEANDIMDAMIQTIGQQRVAAAANGMDIGFGTPVSVENATRDLANLQLGVTRSDAQIRSIARRRQSYATRQRASAVRSASQQNAGSALMSGAAGAGQAIGALVDRRIQRG